MVITLFRIKPFKPHVSFITINDGEKITDVKKIKMRRGKCKRKTHTKENIMRMVKR